MATLKLNERLALQAIIEDTLCDPQTFLDFLDNPDNALLDLGLTDNEIINVMDFLGHFRAKLEAALNQPTDWWPLVS